MPNGPLSGGSQATDRTMSSEYPSSRSVSSPNAVTDQRPKVRANMPAYRPRSGSNRMKPPPLMTSPSMPMPIELGSFSHGTPGRPWGAAGRTIPRPSIEAENPPIRVPKPVDASKVIGGPVVWPSGRPRRARNSGHQVTAAATNQ